MGPPLSRLKEEASPSSYRNGKHPERQGRIPIVHYTSQFYDGIGPPSHFSTAPSPSS